MKRKRKIDGNTYEEKTTYFGKAAWIADVSGAFPIGFLAEDDLSLCADPEKLARVFSNLLRNAAAYSYPNTEIHITEKKIDHNVQITFQNCGKTIAPDQLNSIFEKFHRLDDARLSDTGGAGLGLSIAEEIIHLHDGTISASSENETISFVITLPTSA